jgi:hypothetical protein
MNPEGTLGRMGYTEPKGFVRFVRQLSALRAADGINLNVFRFTGNSEVIIQ